MIGVVARVLFGGWKTITSRSSHTSRTGPPPLDVRHDLGGRVDRLDEDEVPGVDHAR